MPKPSFARLEENEQASQSEAVNLPKVNQIKAFLVVPSDWESRINIDTQERYKSNILRGLDETKQFYASKLNGHSFIYNTEVEVIHAPNPIPSGVSLRNTNYCVANVLDDLGLNRYLRDPPVGYIYGFYVVGTTNISNCGHTYDQINIDHGAFYIAHQIIEQLGLAAGSSLQVNAKGTVIHELGHALGLVYAGWSKAHPCSVDTKDECLPISGLGSSLSYPPASETYGSIMGIGSHLDLYPNAGLNNSIYSPEIQKIYRSIFINPNGDAAPTPTPPPVRKIDSFSPNPIKAGDILTIKGSGFGQKAGHVILVKPNVFIPYDYELKEWSDTQIKIFLKFVYSNSPMSFTISVETDKGYIDSSDSLLFTPSSPTQSSTPTPSPSPTPQPTASPPKITQVSPNPIMVGQEAVISGSGFGQNRSIIIQPVDANLLRIGNYRINIWTDTEIRISILDGPVTPTPYNFILVYLGKDILSPQVIIQKPSSSVSPTTSPGTIQKSTPATSATPTSTSTPTQTTPATPSSVSLIKVSNYKDFRENPPGDEGSATQTFNYPSSAQIVWKKSTLDPGSQVYIAPIKPDGSTGEILAISMSNGQTFQVPNSPFVIQAKVIRRIVKISINDGRGVRDISSDFGQILPISLPGTSGVSGSYTIILIISFNDGSTKSLLFKFNYSSTSAPSPSAAVSTDEAVCNAKGGVCQTSCEGTKFSSQIGTCPSKSQLCCATPVTSPTVSKCSGNGPAPKGFGGPCSPNDADIVSPAEGGAACTVASCYFNPDIKEYCWYNSGSTYGGKDNYESCKAKGVIITTPAPTIAPTTQATTNSGSNTGFSKTGPCYQVGYDSDIVCHGNPAGAGGQCDSLGQQSNPISCTKTCPDGTQAVGTSISTCGSDGCYTNTCSCNASCIQP